MKGSKRENLLLAVLLGLTGAFLIISYYKVMAGPLRSVLESEATWTMLGEVVLVFAWNLFWLRRAYGGKRDKGAGNLRICWFCVAGGAAVFTWCHQILVPIAVSGIYVAVLILWGRWIHRLFAWKVRQTSVEELSMCALYPSRATEGLGSGVSWRWFLAARPWGRRRIWQSAKAGPGRRRRDVSGSCLGKPDPGSWHLSLPWS